MDPLSRAKCIEVVLYGFRGAIKDLFELLKFSRNSQNQDELEKRFKRALDLLNGLSKFLEPQEMIGLANAKSNFLDMLHLLAKLSNKQPERLFDLGTRITRKQWDEVLQRAESQSHALITKLSVLSQRISSSISTPRHSLGITDPISASGDEVAHATLSADIATLSVDISKLLLGSLGSRTLTISTLSTLSVESNQPENLEEANLELESPWISQDQPSDDQLLNNWLNNLPSESTTTGVDLSISEPVTLRQRPLTRSTPKPPDPEQQHQSPVDPQPQNSTTTSPQERTLTLALALPGLPRPCVVIILLVTAFTTLSCFLGLYFTLNRKYGYSMGDAFTLAGWVVAVGAFISTGVGVWHWPRCRCWKEEREEEADTHVRMGLLVSERG